MTKFVRIQLPPEIFDVEDATAEKRKRVPVAWIDEMLAASTSDEVYAVLARVFPRWQGVLDVETDEPLPNPEDDPAVFARLDNAEQLPWLGEQMRGKQQGNGTAPRRRGAN
jgi:hypothetical protein